MSTLQNDQILESIMDEWDIRPCFDREDCWEVVHLVDGTVHQTTDTFEESRKAREEFILNQWEDMLQ